MQSSAPRTTGSALEVSAGRTTNICAGFPRGGQIADVIYGAGFRGAGRHSPLIRKPGHGVKDKRGVEGASIRKAPLLPLSAAPQLPATIPASTH
ncbi:hypothetical protein [Corynebacterium sp. CCUG 51687]|uniref:hypothetical protein n=1 Tax=Corynebacterium sp. CCUG 51687 TaxID=2823897 RepID=UPI00210AE48D|nr:hypothetical protein [Corynebacterium sp. CCUG 51687]MCQ4612464.1 hypothetical protein [Corynebacterium sp. CCUG 51687]